MSQAVTKRIQELYRQLRAQLDNTRSGRKFHSRRKIMELYRETRYVVDRALQQLTDESIISIHPREGIFINHRLEGEKLRIISCHDDWQSEQMGNFDQAIINVFAGEADLYDFSTQLYPFEAKGFIEQVEALDCDVILLYPPYSLSKNELIRLFALPQTIVFCCNTLSYAGVDAVDLHPEMIGMTAAHHLISNGHRKLAILQSEPWSPAESARINSFLHLSRLNGIEPIIIDCHISNGDYSPTMAHATLNQHIRQFGANFTGIFVLSDASALGALKALEDNGLRVPDDVSVIGNGGFAAAALYSPPLTTVSENFTGFAEAVKAGVEELAAGGRFGLRSVNPILVKRKSVKNINQE